MRRITWFEGLEVAVYSLMALAISYATQGQEFGPSVPIPLVPANLAYQRVVKVVDGDTVHLNRGGMNITCRLTGVDTPETKAPGQPVGFYGPEAASYLKWWLEGKVVRVGYEDTPFRRDRYGRPLVYLYADKGRQLVNLELVRRGFGRFDAQYKTRYRDLFIAAEAEAKAARRGVWSQVDVTGPMQPVPRQ